jgi:hypothetical protein
MKTSSFFNIQRVPKLIRRACRVQIMLVLVLGFISSGCVTRRIHYANRAVNGDLTEINSIIEPSLENKLKAPLAIIEFGDQGNARDPSQTVAAKKLISQTRKPLLVVYVHGWHNNARTYPGRFVNLLNTLAESSLLENEGYQVIGVYVAWHGKQYHEPILEYATTFWNRYDTATKLGAGVDCLSAISDVVTAARAQNTKARTFLIGHSFGGLLLQQAVAQSVADAQRDGSSLAPADLTLFLNPASESEITRQMIERLRTNVTVQGNENAYPIFATLSSEGDLPNKGLFSFGKSLAGFTKHFDRFPVRDSHGTASEVSGRYFFTHTPGNNIYLRSHRTSKPENISMPAGAVAFEENLRTPIDPRLPRFKTKDEITQQWLQWNLEPVIEPASPYWVVQVDRQIMKDHNDIFNPRAVALMASLYRLNLQLTKDKRGGVRLQSAARDRQRVPLPSAAEVQSYSDKIRTMAPATLKSFRAPVPAPVATKPR